MVLGQIMVLGKIPLHKEKKYFNQFYLYSFSLLFYCLQLIVNKNITSNCLLFSVW